MCEICSSKLLGEVNRKQHWQPDRLIRWANQRGLNIKSDQLAEHFDKHLKSNAIKKTIETKKAAKSKSTQPEAEEIPTAIIIDNQPGPGTPPLQTHSADDQFLNEIIGRVFNDLIANKFDLKLEYGFKAIELKQKISETTNVESMLLDLLNEIRGQELGQTKTHDSNPIK